MSQYSFIILSVFLLSSPLLAPLAWAADEAVEQGDASTNPDEDAGSADASGKTLPQRVLPNLFKQREQDIERYLTSVQREDELVNLSSGSGSFTGFLLPERTGKPQGGVLILPDNGQHGHWPRIVAPLRDYLPDYGWQTLTISLPDVPKTRLQRSEPEQNGIDTDPAAAPNSTQPQNSQSDYYAQQMPERINSAYNFLNQQGQLNVVIIANGHSAAWAASWLASQNISEENKRGFTLVIIDALDDAYAPVKLRPTMSELEFPILDLITPFNLNNELTNKKRAGAMRHKKREQYQQMILSSHGFNQDYSNEINRTVRGWLSKNAAGTEGKVVEKD